MALTFFVYLPIFRVFFQQDEWTSFGRFFAARGIDPVKTIQAFFTPTVGHYVPLTQLFTYLYFQIFEINSYSYALESLGAHLLIVFLIYTLSSKIFSNRIYALLTAGFFALNASSHQATSWLVADINTHISTIFALLSMLSLLNWRKVWLSIVLLITALLFKETPIGLFLILPLGVYLFNGGSQIEKFRIMVKILTSGFLYLLFRVSMVFLQKTLVAETLVTKSQSIYEILVNLFTFPTKILAQLFMPTRLLLFLARSLAQVLPQVLTGARNTTAFDRFIEGTSLQIIYWIIFIVLVGGVYFLIRKIKDAESKKAIIFGLSFFFINSLIYILSPGRPGNIPDVDSRNLYFPLIGVSIFLISLFNLLFMRKIIKLILTVVFLTAIHVVWLHKELINLSNVGQERRTILEQVKLENPKLPQKTVFYMESDKPFYGLADDEKIFPFQMNLGFILLVWYWPTENFPASFGDQTKFLYKLTAEEYKGDGERGFGYYRNFQSLTDAVLKYNLPVDSIIAYRFNSLSQKIEDITYQTQSKFR